jgi:hypothetical protein
MDIKEIEEALKNDAALQGGVITLLQREQFGTDFLGNYSKSKIDEAIGVRTGEIHGSYDKDILESTGIPKQEGEKSYDYLKRANGVLKDSSKGSDEYKTTIAELQEKLKSNAGAEIIQRNFDAATNTWNEQRDTMKKDYDALKQSNISGNIQRDIQTGLTGLKFKADIPEAVRTTYIKTVQDQIAASAEIDANGSVTYKGSDGQPLMDKTTFRPQTAAQLMQEKLADILDTGRQQGGGGSDPKLPTEILKDKEGLEKIDITSCKSQIEITTLVDETCVKLGIAKGSIQHDKILTNSLTEGKTLPFQA